MQSWAQDSGKWSSEAGENGGRQPPQKSDTQKTQTLVSHSNSASVAQGLGEEPAVMGDSDLFPFEEQCPPLLLSTLLSAPQGSFHLGSHGQIEFLFSAPYLRL